LAGQTSQHDNSIILNASGSAVSSVAASRLYINPIRVDSLSGETAGALQWDSGTYEVIYNSTKTFIIDHPLDNEKYLVHACLEGPEAGVYYRGSGCIPSGKDCVEISLPDYVDKLAREFVVNLTPVGKPILLGSSHVKSGKFTVFRRHAKSKRSEFFWVVFAKREDIEIEPLKQSVNVHGDGPYKWHTRI
jgi:hypothetical protein